MSGATLLNVLVAAVLGYALLVGIVFVTQERLVYFPDIGRDLAITPRAFGLDFESVQIATEDGERLHGWWVPVDRPRGTVLLFHGNAGNIAARVDYLLMFHRLGYSTLIVDYRGYGQSTGRPSESGTYRDAEAAWRWLTGTLGIRTADIVLFGESLGGAVASWLAVRIPHLAAPSVPYPGAAPRALILASTFTSINDLGAEVYPFLPVRLISRIHYDNRANLQAARVPVLIAHSPGDELIPYAHGRRLFEAAREPKQFLELAGGHNDGFIFMREAWVQALGRFLAQHAPHDK
jgi:fermentation-respiration switch protein FrsA (DUF1100 family)